MKVAWALMLSTNLSLSKYMLYLQYMVCDGETPGYSSWKHRYNDPSCVLDNKAVVTVAMSEAGDTQLVAGAS